ncbi:Ribonuclease H-like superfamily [Sesbania bispinosa]|nr:Ribonuclease H-like superfamily [Sesbania bispinosa]
MCLDADKWDINFIIRSINVTHDEFIRFLGDHGRNHLYQLRTAKWSPPPQDSIKLNVDGSFLQDSRRMGVGGVFRNSSTDFLGGFNGFVGRGDSLEAEMLAVLNGLEFAWMKG